jgi:hypothetical protein
MPALVAGIHVFLPLTQQLRRGWPGKSTFTRVFNALCPAMTMPRVITTGQ